MAGRWEKPGSAPQEWVLAGQGPFHLRDRDKRESKGFTGMTRQLVTNPTTRPTQLSPNAAQLGCIKEDASEGLHRSWQALF